VSILLVIVLRKQEKIMYSQNDYNYAQHINNVSTVMLFVCLFSWRYKSLLLYFPQPGSGL
jgi:hypothetical protein